MKTLKVKELKEEVVDTSKPVDMSFIVDKVKEIKIKVIPEVEKRRLQKLISRYVKYSLYRDEFLEIEKEFKEEFEGVVKSEIGPFVVTGKEVIVERKPQLGLKYNYWRTGVKRRED